MARADEVRRSRPAVAGPQGGAGGLRREAQAGVVRPMTGWGGRLPPALRARLALPLIAAPMLRVSGPDLVVAACRAGVVGAFPTKNARTTAELDTWLGDIRARLADQDGPAAPFCPNLIMRDARLGEDLACVARHGAELVNTSVGSPAPAV